MSTNDCDFVSNLMEKLSRPQSVQESAQHREVVYTQLKYGLVALFYAIAKREKWIEARNDGTLKGAVQMVIEPSGWIRPYEGKEKEPDIKPVTMSYIVPGTGWKWNNGECLAQPEYNWNLVGACLYVPLYQPTKEAVEGQIALLEKQSVPRKNESLLDAFIRELLQFAVERCWGHEVTRKLVVQARRNKPSGKFEKLTAQEKRLEMRGLLIRLNEENLKKRRQQNQQPVPNLKMADTQRGREWNSDDVYKDIEATRPVPRRRTYKGTDPEALEQIANAWLSEHGSEELNEIPSEFNEVIGDIADIAY